MSFLGGWSTIIASIWALVLIIRKIKDMKLKRELYVSNLELTIILITIVTILAIGLGSLFSQLNLASDGWWADRRAEGFSGFPIVLH